MKVRIDTTSPIPIYEQISEQLRSLIRTGVAGPQSQIPSVRELARQAGINPLTVARAYLELEREGYIESRVGRGTFVAGSPPTMLEGERRKELRNRLRLFLQQYESLVGSVDELLGLVEDEARDLRSARGIKPS